MPKYYCDYCDTYLTHDSPSVRKTHNNGRKHKENVRLYYQQWMEEQAQKLVDATARAFKDGRGINPLQGMIRPGGAMIPPPVGMGGPRMPYPYPYPMPHPMMQGMRPPMPMPPMPMPPAPAPAAPAAP